jgi:hypothetical protein
VIAIAEETPPAIGLRLYDTGTIRHEAAKFADEFYRPLTIRAQL